MPEKSAFLKPFLAFCGLVFILLLTNLPLMAQEEESVRVQAVFFYSPTCPHCHLVINDVLTPLKMQYGGQLQLVGINTSQKAGVELFAAMHTAFNVPDERKGVPALVVGDIALVGSAEIPEQLPDLITEGLAAGGIGWPDIPGLREAVPNLPPSVGEVDGETAVTARTQSPHTSTEDSSNTLLENEVEINLTQPPSDPIGMAIAWGVAAFLALAFLYALWRLLNDRPHHFDQNAQQLSGYIIPILTLIGLGVALYLAYIEMSQSEAVCGPVGHCNIVQASQYAQIFGIPIAVLGVLNYATIGGLWLIVKFSEGRERHWAIMGLITLTMLSVLFSIYLTALELFVIHAVCAWCLTSAVVSALLMLVIVNGVTKQSKTPKTNIPAAQMR